MTLGVPAPPPLGVTLKLTYGIGSVAFGVSAAVLSAAVLVSVASYEIPSTALTPELAPDYDKRTSLLAYRWFFAITAIAVTNIVLYTVYLRKDDANPLGVLNAARYAEFGAMAAIVMFVC